MLTSTIKIKVNKELNSNIYTLYLLFFLHQFTLIEMLKTGFLLTILAFVVSDVMGAGPYSPPETWECDSPGTDGLFITDDAIKFGDAAAACAKHNGVLADITNQNFLLATDMVLNCVGENQNAWIR